MLSQVLNWSNIKGCHNILSTLLQTPNSLPSLLRLEPVDQLRDESVVAALPMGPAAPHCHGHRAAAQVQRNHPAACTLPTTLYCRVQRNWAGPTHHPSSDATAGQLDGRFRSGRSRAGLHASWPVCILPEVAHHLLNNGSIHDQKEKLVNENPAVLFNEKRNKHAGL